MKYCVLILFFLHSSMVCFASGQGARGTEVFHAYCSGCHSAQYARPSIKSSLSSEDAVLWFGKMPPDLSLIVGVRGEAWLHDYLLGFYADLRQSYGENNRLLPHLKMPNPFPLLSSTQKEALVEDLVAFLSEVAFPHAKQRHQAGFWILLWLFCFNIALYYLYLLIQKKINTKK